MNEIREKIPAVSIIMPVHNAGKYLEEALNSLFRQTMMDFELICIDDASDDIRTKKILTIYSSIYKQIKVLETEKSIGAAASRNLGLRYANADYIIFLDSDDVFNPNLLEKMYGTICKENADVCFCGFRSFANIDGIMLYSTNTLPHEYPIEIEGRTEDWIFYEFKAPWNKMVRKDFLINNHIYFQSLDSYNDLFFSYMVELKARKISYCKSVLVEYRLDNVKRISARREPKNFLRAIEHVLGRCEVKNNSQIFSQVIIWLLRGMPFEMSRTENVEYKRTAYEMVQNFLNDNKKLIHLENCYYQYMLECFLKKTFESNWYQEAITFDFQYSFFKKQILSVLDSYSKIILWGLGERGRAFQRFCKEYGVNLYGCVDKNDGGIGTTTQYGNLILAIKDISKADLIVASNTSIYQYALHHTNRKVINLQQYEVGTI